MGRRGPFKRRLKKRRSGANFWDTEYKKGENLALSEEASEDLKKFTRWISRQEIGETLDENVSVVDIGCGNGRNLLYLNEEFGVKGYGFDVSATAIKQARSLSEGRPLEYKVQSMAKPIELPDESQSLALDMMSSHFLDPEERKNLYSEIYRILKPGGWLFLKTFLRDDDLHTERLLKDYPGKNENSYIHPVMGLSEYVYFEKDLREFVEENFDILKIYRSHKHKLRGRARKRRTISIYAQKDPFK